MENKAKPAWNRGSKDTFIAKALAAHGDKYDYTDTAYVSYHAKVEILCKTHGMFSQKPAHHCAGIGCPRCGRALATSKVSHSKEDFIAKARETHGDLYTYEAGVYKNRHTKIDITCKTHGVWSVSPNSHITGSGCPACASGGGFNLLAPAHLYILSCGDMTKVGITGRAVDKRASEIGNAFGYEFHVKDSFYFEDGNNALSVETVLLNYLRAKYKSPTTKFQGSRECFFNIDMDDLTYQIKQEMGRYG